VGRPPAGRSGIEREEMAARARAWAERTCMDQGVPFVIAEREALAQIGELLGWPGQSRQIGRKRDSSKRL
jgi:hypothetical protein